MGDKSNCDSPDLWDQIRTAKENLFKNEQFSVKYRSTPSSPTMVAVKNTPQDEPDARDVEIKARPAPEQKSPPAAKIQKNTAFEAAEVAVRDGDTSAPPVNETTSSVNKHQVLWRTPTPSSSSPQPSGVPHQTRPCPCIPRTRAEILLRARRENQPTNTNHHIHVPHTPHTPSPLSKSVPEVSTPVPRKPSRPLQTVISHETAATKMTESEESDEIVFAHRDKRRANNTPAPGGLIPSRDSRRTRPPYNLEPLRKLLKQNDRRVSQGSAAWVEDLHKGVALPVDNQADEPTSTPSTQKENHRINQFENEAKELARLRNEIVVNAHRRPNDDLTASPEMLTSCRDGPGVDRSSKVYHEIVNTCTASQEGIADSSYLPGHSQIISTEAPQDTKPEQLESDLVSRLKLYRELYKKSPTAYPIYTHKNKKIVLSPTPTEKHQDALARVRECRRELTPQPISHFKGKEVVEILETSWHDPVILDWEYCPRTIPDENAYRVRFQCWLEDTIKRECAVDIFHQAFFDGTAHADGQTSMFMLDMRNYETLLDPNDKASLVHAHETAAGYCYNIVLQNKKADEAEEHRKQIDREVRLEARRLKPLRSPSSPVANIYLRPVDVKDIPELRTIYNWYARNSFDSPNTEDLDYDEVRQCIYESRNANLPFIVAIDRRSASTSAEKILGYALARDFDGHHRATRFTAELEVYVKDGHTRLGIGRCLLDKLLEVCDPTYRPRSGYLFEATPEDRFGYYPGGRRRLARLVFTLCYVDRQEISEHKKVKEWLKEYAGFEEQGLLHGVRVKNNYFVNAAYLVRNIGHGKSNKLDP